MSAKAMRVGALVALLQIAVVAEGQVLCDLNDTIRTCWLKHNPPADSDDAKRADNEDTTRASTKAAKEVTAEPTGAETGETNFSSTTKNFLPLLSLAGLLSESEDEQAEGVAAFDVNLPFLNGQQRRNLKVRLLVDTETGVGEAVKEALPEADRATLVEELEKGLSDVDDYTLSLSYNAEGRGHGRSFKLYRDEFSALALAAREQVGTEARTAANFALAELIQKYTAEVAQEHVREHLPRLYVLDEVRNAPDEAAREQVLERLRAALEEEADEVAQVEIAKPFEDWTLANPQDAARVTETAAKASADVDAAYSAALHRHGLDKFADLVANQPQFHLSAAWKPRDELVGGEELSGKITYEWSSINLKGALDDSACSDLQNDAADCLDSYQEYVESHAAGIDNGTRVSFSGEWVEIDERTVDLSKVGLDSISIDGSSKLIVALVLSRNWTDVDDSTQPVRIDFEAKYEDVSDDPMRRDRGVATLTVSKKINNVSFPISLVYANHSKFLPDVDDELSTHIGVKFDFLSKKDKE